eukprot:4287120-Prorocentrum_lima.AAC.1
MTPPVATPPTAMEVDQEERPARRHRSRPPQHIRHIFPPPGPAWGANGLADGWADRPGRVLGAAARGA